MSIILITIAMLVLDMLISLHKKNMAQYHHNRDRSEGAWEAQDIPPPQCPVSCLHTSGLSNSPSSATALPNLYFCMFTAEKTID